ncbi:hypothetical protein AB0J35_60820 [Nonomuraea angiospora]|uniref:hypothetical protein n=1 Tax=Nonomuraea angiospora TaxID=46172 RepID=UPI00341DA59C
MAATPAHGPSATGSAHSVPSHRCPHIAAAFGGGAVYSDPGTGVVLQTLHLAGDQFYSELHLGRLNPANGWELNM